MSDNDPSLDASKASIPYIPELMFNQDFEIESPAQVTLNVGTSSLRRATDQVAALDVFDSAAPKIEKPDGEAAVAVNLNRVLVNLQLINESIWDKYLDTLAAIDKQKEVRHQQELIENSELRVEDLNAELRDEAEQIGALAAQIVINLAVMALLFDHTSPVYKSQQLGMPPEITAAREVSENAVRFLSSTDKIEELRGRLMERVDRLYEGLPSDQRLTGEEKLAVTNRWMSVIQVTVAFSAMSVGYSAATQGAGRAGVDPKDIYARTLGDDDPNRYLQQILKEEIPQMEEAIGKEETESYLDMLASRFAGEWSTVGNPLGIVKSFLARVASDATPIRHQYDSEA